MGAFVVRSTYLVEITGGLIGSWNGCWPGGGPRILSGGGGGPPPPRPGGGGGPKPLIPGGGGGGGPLLAMMIDFSTVLLMWAVVGKRDDEVWFWLREKGDWGLRSGVGFQGI